MTTETVKFNVGGKHFEVSRSLIETQHADSMLGRLISETWNSTENKNSYDGEQDKSEDAESSSNSNSNKGNENIIFIDRDGDSFGHILNYLRYGKLFVPLTFSKELVVADMDYYGIPHEDGNIQLSSSDFHNFQGAEAATKIKNLKEQLTQQRGALTKTYEDQISTYEKHISALDEQQDILIFASECFQKFVFESSDTKKVVSVDLCPSQRFYKSSSAKVFLYNFYRLNFGEQRLMHKLTMLNKAMAIYNLTVKCKEEDGTVLQISAL